MILKRLSAAIKTCGPAAVMQVHRANWAAFAQAIAPRQRADLAIVTLATDTGLQLSLVNMLKTREAGVLPR